jgi:DNA-directed RNA polymerase subunit omega
MKSGQDPFVEWENDKATVVALREVAGGFIGPEILTESQYDEGIL